MPFTPTLGRESTISDVRTQLGDAARYALELRSRPADQRGDAATFEADLRSAVDFINFADPLERALAAEGRTAPVVESRGGRSNGVDLGDSERRSLGRQVVEADGFADWAGGSRSVPFTVETRNLIGGFTTGAYDTNSDAFAPVTTPVMLDQVIRRRRLFVRDLLSVSPTGLRVIPYIRENAAVSNETGAQMVSEGSAKAEVVAAFDTYQAVVQKIAAWLPITDEIATDAPTLMGYIDNRLTYMLDIREEQQVLSGTGTAPQLEGITVVSGTQTQASVTGTDGGDFQATIGTAIGKVENVDLEADGVVVNPIDYWTATTKRFTKRLDNAQFGQAPSADGNITWGLPAVRTRAMSSGSGIVGSWRIASTLFDRMQTTVKVADQHSDFFIRNLRVVLAERRVALAHHRPDGYVILSVPTS